MNGSSGWTINRNSCLKETSQCYINFLFRLAIQWKEWILAQSFNNFFPRIMSFLFVSFCPTSGFSNATEILMPCEGRAGILKNNILTPTFIPPLCHESFKSSCSISCNLVWVQLCKFLKVHRGLFSVRQSSFIDQTIWHAELLLSVSIWVYILIWAI